MMNKVFRFFTGSKDEAAGSKDEAVGNSKASNSDYDLMLAVAKTKKFLSSNGENLYDICLAVECAETKSALEAALLPFNRITRILRTAVSDPEQKNIVVDALNSLNCSKRLINYLQSAANIHDGILSYKTTVVKKLNVNIGRMEDLRRSDNAFDQILLTSHLSERTLKLTDSGRTMERKDNQNEVVVTRSPVNERTISLVMGSVNENQHEDNTKGRSGSHIKVYEDHRHTNKRARGYSDLRRRTRDSASDQDGDNLCWQHNNGNCRRGRKCRKRHSD